ncbi:response regulator receiver protein [Chlorobium phaeovibrioides]|uniref:Response regulator receiver protein n=1 Tax=Chlorobium phaeovibrioides TaxID=1094 RepID=A0A3S0MRG9_CHLPH|nr:response regulator receiver protein [Chlorobium phaeovibrioides]RTY39563.1 response regulator receiver protein [Chlorobium phaeovibrioides]
MATKPIEKHSQLAQVSVAKAEEIDRVTQNPGGERGALITLINSIYLADIPTDAKRSMTDLLQQLIEHAQLEARFRTLLTKADAAFIKKLEADYPNLTQRDTLISLFIKLGYDTREIARRVGISTRGMESIRYRLHKKIGRAKNESIKMYLGGV